MELYLDTNVYLAWFSYSERTQYVRSKDLFESILGCKHSIVFSELVEKELTKKSGELKIKGNNLLASIVRIGKARKVPAGSLPRNSRVPCIHYPDSVHLGLCKEGDICFVSFDGEAVECAEEQGITAFGIDDLYRIF